MTEIPQHLDHIVYATPELAATVADVTARTGVTPVPGGAHPGRGTRNYLLGLGGARYLEIIGPDPDQPEPHRPRPFGIDGLTAARAVTWAIRPDDLDATVTAARARGYDPGDVVPMSRRTPDRELLSWRLAPSEAAHPSGLVPFLSDWGDARHPTDTGLPTLALRRLAGAAPDPGTIRPLLAAVGTDLDLAAGPVGLELTVDGPKGTVTLR
jgi:hypothetical protein